MSDHLIFSDSIPFAERQYMEKKRAWEIANQKKLVLKSYATVAKEQIQNLLEFSYYDQTSIDNCKRNLEILVIYDNVKILETIAYNEMNASSTQLARFRRYNT